MKKIWIASDHAGLEAKLQIKKHFQHLHQQVEWIDLGTHSDQSVDYPDYANLLCEEILKHNGVGILICGSGQGMAIRANKFKNIRAALCWSSEIAKLSREHNDANVLCLSGRHVSIEINFQIVETFLHTSFLGGRHQQRVEKLCL